MIPSKDYLEQRLLYTNNGEGIWKILSYCDEPTVTMENIITKQRETFGITGLTARNFSPINEENTPTTF